MALPTRTRLTGRGCPGQRGGEAPLHRKVCTGPRPQVEATWGFFLSMHEEERWQTSGRCSLQARSRGLGRHGHHDRVGRLGEWARGENTQVFHVDAAHVKRWVPGSLKSILGGRQREQRRILDRGRCHSTREHPRKWDSPSGVLST